MFGCLSPNKWESYLSLEDIKSGGKASQMFGDFPKRESEYTPRAECDRMNVCSVLCFVGTKIDLCLFARKKFSSVIKRFKNKKRFRH